MATPAHRRLTNLTSQVAPQSVAATQDARPLAGRTALVTGSAGGIGLGIAECLAAAGANVLIHGLMDRAQGEKLAGELGERHGVRTAFADHNVAVPEQAVALVRYAALHLGPVDVLVNNAGIQHIAPIESFPPEKWDQIIAINLSACFHTTRAVLPSMKERKYGRIINIASAHALVASVNKSAYVAAKHGLLGFTKATALETAGSGITANAICPGWVLTPLVQAQIDLRAKQQGISVDQARKDLLLEKQPSGQFVTAADLGALAVFLCSEAAAQMTGIALPMDGAWTAQ